ncbi:uncharacterized protein BKA78DRAFT_170534 [Phyllosticta capitalensis]|uniref:uncharacterized protein n=1 Tax=Phyllosticta capitalensis TaxID=121624 RepID=UPI00312DDC72
MERSHRQPTNASTSRISSSLLDLTLPNEQQPPRRPHPQTSGLHLPPIHTRFAGDGLDYRRPVMTTTATSSSAAPNFIDLTSDDDSATRAAPPASTRASRPPRFPNEIIDLCNDDSPNNASFANRPPPSPEVEFISARQVAPTPGINLRRVLEAARGGNGGGGVNGGHPRFTQPEQNTTRRAAERILNERTSVQGTRRAPRPTTPRRRHHHHRGNSNTDHRADLAYLRQAMGGGDPAEVLGFGTFPRLMPGLLNYEMTGFDLGNEREPSPPPTYKAPDAAGPGFTRSPEEDEVLVCPNCDAELCDGDEGSKKRQVWIIKACGHAYCGECTFYRGSSKRKGKDVRNLSPAFKECVVNGCHKKCKNPSAMIQLFL